MLTRQTLGLLGLIFSAFPRLVWAAVEIAPQAVQQRASTGQGYQGEFTIVVEDWNSGAYAKQRGATVTLAFRRDGARLEIRQLYDSQGHPKPAIKRIWYPDGVQVRVVDAIRAKTTEQLSPSEYAKRDLRRPAPAENCLRDARGLPSLDGSFTLETIDGHILAKNVRVNGNIRWTAWLDPQRSCTVIRQLTEKEKPSILWKSEWTPMSERRLVSVTDRVDPTLFEVPAEYQETRPSRVLALLDEVPGNVTGPHREADRGEDLFYDAHRGKDLP